MALENLSYPASSPSGLRAEASVSFSLSSMTVAGDGATMTVTVDQHTGDTSRTVTASVRVTPVPTRSGFYITHADAPEREMTEAELEGLRDATILHKMETGWAAAKMADALLMRLDAQLGHTPLYRAVPDLFRW